MGNEIPVQLAQFFRSILLGAMLALVYDLVRALRRLGGQVWEIVLDTVVSLFAVSSLFFLVMAEEGELRLFIVAGTLGGAVLFFSLLSPVLRPIWEFWVTLFCIPARLSSLFLKKVYFSLKKVFSFVRKRFTIKKNSQENLSREEQTDGTQSEEVEIPSQR
ncbi:MAG: spore cortex biosynthesis protein YabQ [Oscillospiraceae bacterium]|nr:spore cortex biosynthesis protein YabQ [Oscillospiraceae bacterium]